jgi:drug/metabolite transporter (DMT)-like permease
VARGLSQTISQTFTVIALFFLPLSGAIAIGFSAPLFAALISLLWLRERADGPRVAALVAGFLGVLVVAGPGADSLQIGALFALANAVMYGSVTVAVRGMTKTESTTTLLMWQWPSSLSATPRFLPSALQRRAPPTPRCSLRAVSPTVSRNISGQGRCASRRPPPCRRSTICSSSGQC